MDTSSITLRIIPVELLVTAVAFALLAWAMFVLARRARSRIGHVSSALFAYCAATLVARFVLFFAPLHPAHPAFEAVTSTWAFHFVLNGARPYALVVAACCAIVVARQSQITSLRDGDTVLS